MASKSGSSGVFDHRHREPPLALPPAVELPLPGEPGVVEHIQDLLQPGPVPVRPPPPGPQPVPDLPEFHGEGGPEPAPDGGADHDLQEEPPRRVFAAAVGDYCGGDPAEIEQGENVWGLLPGRGLEAGQVDGIRHVLDVGGGNVYELALPGLAVQEGDGDRFPWSGGPG